MTYAQPLPPGRAPPTPSTPALLTSQFRLERSHRPWTPVLATTLGPSLPPDQPASTETMWWARRRCTHHIPTRVGGSGLGSRSCLLRQACKPPDAVRQRLRDDAAIELRHCPIPYTRLNRPSGNCSTLCSSIACRADDENNALPSPTISG